MVHINDIKSFYPTLLCLVVSSSAVLYGAIQQFAPSVWESYYYNPTLNPLTSNALPIRLFLLSLWTMLIVLIAVIDDVFKQPAVVDAVAYLASLLGLHGALFVFLPKVCIFILVILSWLPIGLLHYIVTSNTIVPLIVVENVVQDWKPKVNAPNVVP